MARVQDRRWQDSLMALAPSRKAIARAFAGLLPGSKERLASTLPEGDLPRIEAQIAACIEGRGGAASARARAAELGRTYLALAPEARTRFLSLLAEKFGPDRQATRAAAEALLHASDEALQAARRALARSLESPRLKLLKQFNGLEQGVKFLVDLRADLLALKGRDPALAGLETELFELLASWFDVGFLELTRITWEAPAALLEKLVAYEAVHAITSWDDLKNRLDSDRRCYAFFHPAMPGEPLIFVEIALVNGLAGRVQDLLDEDAPASDPDKANTAIFYSISNAQKGLQGVGFGDFLIKQVVDRLTHDLPNLKTFATLSPIPGFCRWLERQLKTTGDVLTPEEAEQISALAGADGAGEGEGLLRILSRLDWFQDEAAARALEPILMRLCARYLLTVRPGDEPRALDSVAHFHLTNGARIERLNWLADTSRNGLSQSAGLMVNYLYKLADIETNHERYRAEGRVAASGPVKTLA